jgi:hypothetical protein
MEKLVAEKKKMSMDKVSDYDRIWYLVNKILIEKGYFIDGILRDGDISEDLLKKIGKVLRERMEGNKCWTFEYGGPYRRDFDEA